METIIFQVIDWKQQNEIIEDTEETEDDSEELTDDEKKKNQIIRYKIRLYGRTNENKSIYVNVDNYTPYFYVKVPNDWNDYKIQCLVSHIKSKIKYKSALEGLKGFDSVMRKDLYGFTAYKDFKFVRFIFHNMKSFKTFENWIQKNSIENKLLSNTPFRLKLYESNIEAFIRCMHIQKLCASGWIKISNYTTYLPTHTYCDIAIKTHWKNLVAYDSNSIQKFVIASVDIECMSLGGDFPQAIDPDDKVNFEKMLNNLVVEIKKDENKYKNDNELLNMILHNPKSYPKYNYYEFKKPGDPIIQIGTTLSYYGDSEPFSKHIITLGGCKKIKGLEDVEIKCYDDEKKVLLSWTKLIQKTNPDIITGWNIVGFDFPYMYDRCRKLKILDKFSELSRIRGEKSIFNEKTLSSSALGDNILRFFDMEGRIIIDMMKERQREAKLDSYKLDFVASTYIKEKITMLIINANKDFQIYTPSIYGIKSDDYINIT